MILWEVEEIGWWWNEVREAECGCDETDSRAGIEGLEPVLGLLERYS